MKRKGLSRLGCGLMLGYAAFAAGCTEFVADSARDNIADFFTTILTEAVETAIAPEG